ncbi:MAG TPA: LLM class F420-dependent oxidoreductase [Egibacteraceae bacterium]|nr:LLM class F420-dependent oxidoreductase [Egibacteraceae bacterium]
MKFGITMFPTDEAMRPDELAIAVEDRGFDSLWFPEHTHIPASRDTPYPGGGDLPREYARTHDPLVALAFAAGVTERLLLGTGVCLVVERDPIVLAKEVASLDALSGGRVLFGVGAGWNREEMRNHGTDPATRFELLRERVEAMKQIWTQDEATYHGDFVNFDRVWSWPKPVRRPHPPIVIGGAGASALQRVVDYGDEWMPIARGWGAGDLARRVAELRRLAQEAGRGHIPVTAYSASSKPESVEQFAEAGVERLVFWAPPAPADQVLPLLDRYAPLVERYAGA